MSDQNTDTKKRRFIPHPDAERFDKVVVEVVERWKESELSGDEWRFSHRASFFRHGRQVTALSDLSLERVLLRAAAEWRNVKVPVPGKEDTYENWMGDLSEVCCQPACNKPWVVLVHPKQRYTDSGEQLVRPYNDDEVRGFCERHKHRGDCGLDDSDLNYEVVEERFPPDWTTGDNPRSALADALQWVWNDICTDSGTVPDSFTFAEDDERGTLLTADFAAGTFLARVEQYLFQHGYELTKRTRDI